MFTKEEGPQSGDADLENISGAFERYLDKSETAQAGECLTEEEAIKSILEKTKQAFFDLTEEEAIKSILGKTRRTSPHEENIPDEDNKNLEIAMENIYTSQRLLEEHNEFSKKELIHIVSRLNEAKKALGKLPYRNLSLTDRLQIGRLQKKLGTKAERLFSELARHMHMQVSGDEQRTEIELKTVLKEKIIKFLREAEKSIKFIHESYLSNSETPTS